MSIVFSDNFPTSLDATNWTQQNGTWAWQASTQVRNTVRGTVGLLRTTTTAHAALADCLATVTQADGSGQADGGPLVRGTTGAGSGNTCYYLDVDCVGGAAAVFRRVAGADTLVGSSDGIVEAANGACALSATGTGGTVTIKKYYKGVQVSSDISDTNAARIVAAGQTGILNWNTNNNNDCDYDTFSVDDLVVVTAKYLLVSN